MTDWLLAQLVLMATGVSFNKDASPMTTGIFAYIHRILAIERHIRVFMRGRCTPIVP